MFEDLALYQEKIENRDNRINELKEELKQLEKNIEANNRIFMRKNQKNSKPAKKNMFLFHSSRTGINNINKKQDIIIYKKNIKPQERKKAKSTPKIWGNISINKNNYFITNSEKKNFNFNYYGTNRGKTLDFKNNKINLNKKNNNIDFNKNLFKEKIDQSNIKKSNNNMKQIIVNESFTNNEKNKIKINKTEPNYINNFDNNYIENLGLKKKENIFVNKNIINISTQYNYNNIKVSNSRKDNINKDIPTKIRAKVEKNNFKKDNVNVYKNIENYIESVFGQYFLYYKNNVSLSDNNGNKK